MDFHLRKLLNHIKIELDMVGRFDYPTNVEDQVSRANCIRFLRSQPGIKFTNSSMTHVYFERQESI